MCGHEICVPRGDVVPQDVRHAVEEVAHQRLAPLLLVGRPRRRCRPQPGDGHDQHDERRGLAAAAPPGGDEEARPVRQQRALDQGERGGNDCRLADVVGGDVDQPLVAQELHRRLHALRRAVLALRDDRPQLILDEELDAALAVEAVRGQQVPVRQDDGVPCAIAAAVGSAPSCRRMKCRTNCIGRCTERRLPSSSSV